MRGEKRNQIENLCKIERKNFVFFFSNTYRRNKKIKKENKRNIKETTKINIKISVFFFLIFFIILCMFFVSCVEYIHFDGIFCSTTAYQVNKNTRRSLSKNGGQNPLWLEPNIAVKERKRERECVKRKTNFPQHWQHTHTQDDYILRREKSYKDTFHSEINENLFCK